MIMVVLGVLFGRQGHEPQMGIEKAFTVICLFALLPSFITFYSFYFVIFPNYILQRKIIQSIIYGILFSLLGGVISYMTLTATFGDNCGIEDEEEASVLGIILFISFIAMISGIIALIIQGFITWIEEIKLKENLKQKNQEMELALVKSQLDPHFLFNTINNIDVLILRDADEASNYLNKLSDIMRFMLFETKTDVVPLSKEIQYIKKYIELQKIRTANESYVQLNITGNESYHTIAPMVFISFIENAFKHTTNKKLENAITINIFIRENEIQFTCINKLDKNRKSDQESNGLGNKLIQKRLDLIYPDMHRLELKKEENQYNVDLTIYYNG